MIPHHDGRMTETRQHILFEAHQLYAAGGYDKINLQVIADHLHITKAALFHHFKNKQELFFEMMLVVIEHMRFSFVDVLATGAPTAREQLVQLLSSFTHEPSFDIVRFQREEQRHLSSDQLQEISRRWETGPWALVQRVFEGGIASGELRPHNVHVSITLFLTLSLLLPVFLLDGAAPSTASALITSLVDTLIDGLGQHDHLPT